MSRSASPPAEHSLQRLLSLADACVLCGLCLPHCPTYRLDARESESPRGRVLLAQALARDPDGVDASSIEALEHCLGCGRCEQVCPAKVRFGELMRLTRQQMPQRPRSVRVRALLWASRHPIATAAIVRAARPLRALLPRRQRRALQASANLEQLQRHSQLKDADRRDDTAPVGASHLRVGLLLGCVGRALEAHALNAAARLLRACGHEVLVPAGQVCCGALDQHAGFGTHAEALHAQSRRVWSALAPDVVVSTSSGCQAAHAAALANHAAVTDLASLLIDDAAFAAVVLRRVERRVALHLPCTQHAALKSVQATRILLGRIPGLQLVELPDTGCCGAGGAHMLAFPERAERLRRPLLDAVIACGATTLLSANLGCRLHLGGAAELAGVELRHPLELLAEALP